jgi:hypothetical protein
MVCGTGVATRTHTCVQGGEAEPASPVPGAHGHFAHTMPVTGVREQAPPCTTGAARGGQGRAWLAYCSAAAGHGISSLTQKASPGTSISPASRSPFCAAAHGPENCP